MSALTVTTPSDREIRMTRNFNAPRYLVFECLTTPALLQRWLLGPPGWELQVPVWDLRVGGRFRWVWTRAGGQEMGMNGEFREIRPPERLAHTELFDEDWTQGEALVTTVLTEQEGRTTLEMTILYQARDARDAVLKSGMERGVSDSYDRLDDVLVTMVAS
jgi:uncharacterized protein YndB with AHSA1/START domain